MKSEIPSPATVVAVIEPELTTPVDTQTCAVRRLLENAFLFRGKDNQIPDYHSNLFYQSNPFTHREKAKLRRFELQGNPGKRPLPPLLILDQTEAEGAELIWGGLPPHPFI